MPPRFAGHWDCPPGNRVRPLSSARESALTPQAAIDSEATDTHRELGYQAATEVRRLTAEIGLERRVLRMMRSPYLQQRESRHRGAR
jgi:hypothetical protein